MIKMIPYSPDMDLGSFYEKAAAKGYKNNSNADIMINAFDNEKYKQVWIMYDDDSPVGSVAAHSLDIISPNAFRICARTCVFTDELERTSLRTVTGITTHQNYTAQYLIPTCLEWVPSWGDAFITSNELEGGSQRLVHRIFCPALEKTGVLELWDRKLYRGTVQHFWKVNQKQFYEELNHYGRWSETKYAI